MHGVIVKLCDVILTVVGAGLRATSTKCQFMLLAPDPHPESPHVGANNATAIDDDIRPIEYNFNFDQYCYHS